MFMTLAFAQSTTVTAQPAVQPAPGEVHTQTGMAKESEHATFPPFDPAYYPSQLLWLAISFGVFYYLIAKIISPRIGGILETRQNRIASDLNEATKMSMEANAAVEAYEKDLAIARLKAGAIANDAREAAKAKSYEERKTLDADLNKKIAKAEADIAAIKAKAMAEVSAIAEETVATIVELLAGVKVNAAEAQKATATASARSDVVQAAVASTMAKSKRSTAKPASGKAKTDTLASAKLVSGE